jgi:hypothetical protein
VKIKDNMNKALGQSDFLFIFKWCHKGIANVINQIAAEKIQHSIPSLARHVKLTGQKYMRSNWPGVANM